MICPGTEVFLRNPDRDTRLRRASVRVFEDGLCTVQLDDTTTPPVTGEPVFLYYELDGEFTRQSADVTDVDDEIVTLRPDGAAVSVERRQQPRVSYLHLLQRVVTEPLVMQ